MGDSLRAMVMENNDETRYRDKGKGQDKDKCLDQERSQDKGQNQVSQEQVAGKERGTPPHLLVGPPSPSHSPISLRIDSLVDGRNARTDLRILSVTPCAVYGSVSQVLLYPYTGRRHQLRRYAVNQYTLSIRPINTPYQYALSTHPFNAPYRYALSIHLSTFDPLMYVFDITYHSHTL